MNIAIRFFTIVCLLAGLNAVQAQCNRGFFSDGSGGAIFSVTDGSTTGEGTYRSVATLDEFSYGEVATINNGQLLLRGGEIKTWKNGSGDVTGARLHYRVFYTGETPGAFNELTLNFDADLGSGNQRWKRTNHNVNLLNGQTRSGSYTIEYYFRITTNCSDVLLDNGGGNYQTYVTAFYEINTASTVTQNTTGGASVLAGSGKFVKKGTGTVQLNNANSSYTGGVFLDQGTLSVLAGAGAGNATIRIGPGSGSASGALELADADGGSTLSNVIQVRTSGAGSTLSGSNTSGTNTFSGNIQFEGSALLTAASGGTLSLSGVLDGAAATTKTGAGTLLISGSAANTYTGTTTVSAGALTLSKPADLKAAHTTIVNSTTTLNTTAANQWGTGTPPLLTANGTVNFNNNNQKVALAGTTGSISLGSAVITIDNTGTDSYSGAMTGTGSVVKTGSGTQTLSGTQSYTGSTTATGGTLLIGTSLASTSLVVNGGRLESTASNVIDNSATITVSSGTLDLVTDAIANLTVSGGAVELNASHTLTVSALSVTVDSRFSAASGATLALASGTHNIGTEMLHNLTLQSGATLTVRQGKTLTINGTLNLNGGTLVLEPGAIPAALVYGSSAELYYNTGTSLNPSLEWTSTVSPNSIRIGASTTVTLNSSALACTSITIENTGTLALGTFSLQMRTGGTLTNSGTFTAGTGAIVFKGSNTVAGTSTTQFYNADLDGGGVNFGSNSQLANTLRILAGGFVNTNRPAYGSSATLVYETGGTFDIASTSREWQLGTTSNNPPNVEIRTSSVVVNATGGSGLRAGNLTLVSTGSMTLNPPTTSVASFNLLLLADDLTMTGTTTLTVNNGNGNDLKPTANGAYDVRINGNINIGINATVDLNANIGDDLYVQEDFTIDGTFLPSGRAVYFGGSSVQTLADNGGNTFNFVRVQNSSAANPALNVTTDWTIEDQLEIAQGIVTTETGNTLYLNPNATLTLANINVHYLNGRTEQTKTLSGSSQVAMAYGLLVNPNGNNLGSTTVVTTSGPDGIVNPEGPGFAAGIAKRWDIDPTTQPSSDVDLEFFWSTAHQNSKATDNLFCWRLPTSATEWEVLNATAYDLADGNPAQAAPGFSGFTFSDGGNPLPVELVTFEGQAANGQVLLSWTTATEVNSASFAVERSRDAASFSVIGTVAAAGSSTRVQEYSLTDRNPFPGLNYYRLRQTDLDDTETLSEVISVRFSQAGPDAVFPVPAQDFALVTWTLPLDGQVWLSLTDLSGRVVMLRQEIAQAGSNRFELDLSNLPAGFYQLELRDQQGQRLGGTPLIKQ